MPALRKKRFQPSPRAASAHYYIRDASCHACQSGGGFKGKAARWSSAEPAGSRRSARNASSPVLEQPQPIVTSGMFHGCARGIHARCQGAGKNSGCLMLHALAQPLIGQGSLKSRLLIFTFSQSWSLMSFHQTMPSMG